MSLADLYQEIILDHGRNPRNMREMPDATHVADGYNPLCGDQVKVFLRVVDGVVADASFSGHGCAISTASASMMTQAVRGQSAEKADEIFALFRDAVTAAPEGGALAPLDEAPEDERLGDLNCLTGVRKYPNRIKCAVLAWHAMHSALHQEGAVSTE